MPSIIVVGYFGHCNTGDEQYKETFQTLFESLSPPPTAVTYIDCDSMQHAKFHDDDVIILGGGDVLNDYFLDKMNLAFRNRPNKVLAVSVGIPYLDVLIHTPEKLDIIDAIFLRTQQDMSVLTKLWKKPVHYLPDISIFLRSTSEHVESSSALPLPLINISNPTPRPSSVPGTKPSYLDKFAYQRLIHWLEKNQSQKIIAVSLNRHIYSPATQDAYNDIVSQFAFAVQQWIVQDYYVLFLPFNTKTTSQTENDVLIHTDVYDQVIRQTFDFKLRGKLFNITAHMSVQETYHIYSYVYATVPMRFHACLFTVYRHIPMVPVYTTKKIKNLLLDIGWVTDYPLKTDDKDLPLVHSLDGTALVEKMATIAAKYDEKRAHLVHACARFHQELQVAVPQLAHQIHTPRSSRSAFTSVSAYSDDERVASLRVRINEICREEYAVDDFRQLTDPVAQNVVLSAVSFHLTDRIDSVYSYGLNAKMWNPDFSPEKEWKWILRDHRSKKNSASSPEDNIPLPSNPQGRFNLTYIDQNDRSGSHRYGWQYVYDNIKYLHTSDPAAPLLDLYLDRTFHWKRHLFKLLDIIPYRTPWYGFIHHTFDQSFSEYNVPQMMNCPEFVESLPQCRGLFVLSRTLRDQVLSELKRQGRDEVPVHALIHPTGTDETEIRPFSMEAFMNNPDKKLLHVGGWLRNLYSFYHLDLDLGSPPGPGPGPESSMLSRCWQWLSCRKKPAVPAWALRKVALKGKQMDNYFPEPNFIEKLQQIVKGDGSPAEPIKHISTAGTVKNNWYKHLLDDLTQKIATVDLLEDVSNYAYDQLLSENVVCIQLVDGSAINTLIECIVRNTPICINRHPAVVELLGPHYPLYYDAVRDVGGMLKTPVQVARAHRYLAKMDRTPFMIETFQQELVRILVSVSAYSSLFDVYPDTNHESVNANPDLIPPATV